MFPAFLGAMALMSLLLTGYALLAVFNNILLGIANMLAFVLAVCLLVEAGLIPWNTESFPPRFWNVFVLTLGVYSLPLTLAFHKRWQAIKAEKRINAELKKRGFRRRP